MSVGGGMFAGLLMIPVVIIYIALLGVSIYCLVLFIKLAHRGIKALDIYLSKNKEGQGPGQY